MGAKRFFLFFVILCVLFQSASMQNSSTPPKKIRKIVIDAGHGGHDPGAVGLKSKEKDIVLSIALKLGKKINDSYTDIEVVYTRKTDVFVELFRRAKIANESQAELFISLHCNASKKTSAYGTETWVMGLHKSEENLAVAKKENAAILLEDDYMSQYDGFDPNSPEATAIFSLYQNAHLDQSLIYASNVQKEFKNTLNRVDRGVKQAGFLVLFRTIMPGVLVEAGFISNPDEEKYLMSDKGQEEIATALFNAFKDYWVSVNGMLPDKKPLPVLRDTIAVKPLMSNSVAVIDTLRLNKEQEHIAYTSGTEVKPKGDNICFKVQFATSSVKKPLNSPEFKGITKVGLYFHQGAYKYTSGDEKSLEAAVEVQRNLIALGYKDAFVVAFKNDERITPAEAVRLLKKD